MPRGERDRMSTLNAKLFILAMGLISLILCTFPHSLPNESTVFDPRTLSCASSVFKQYTVLWRVVLIVFQGLPVCSLLVCNTILLGTLIRSARKTHTKPKRSVTIVVIISTIFLVSYLPLGIRSALKKVAADNTSIYIFGYITSLNMMFNPIVYYIVNKKFRKYLKTSITRRFTKSESSGSSQTQSDECQKLKGSDREV